MKHSVTTVCEGGAPDGGGSHTHSIIVISVDIIIIDIMVISVGRGVLGMLFEISSELLLRK